MPKQRIVISNTTPIISLALIGHLDLLKMLYGEVIVPSAVATEILATGHQRTGTKEFQQATWLKRMELVDSRRADLLVDLDRGEAEVIALAQELNADLIILDERLGRRHAQHLGLMITGTLGVLLKAKQQGVVLEIRPLIEQLQKGGIWLGRPLVAKVLQLANEKM
jgi:predicted nucleic acid-binding protein